MWKYKVTPLELFILKELDKGTPEANIPEEIKKEFDIKLTRYKVQQIVSSLLKRKVLLKRNSIVINPAKLFNNVYLAFIKTKVSGAPALAWKEAFDRIIDINKRQGSPIKILFNIGGMGEYDFVALIYSNDAEKYHDFKANLVRMTGIIEKFDTKYVDVPYLFFFDPVAIPDFKECQEIREYFREQLKEEFIAEEEPEEGTS